MSAINPDIERHDRWLLKEILCRLTYDDLEHWEVKALNTILTSAHPSVMNRVDAEEPAAGVRHLRLVPTNTETTTGA